MRHACAGTMNGLPGEYHTVLAHHGATTSSVIFYRPNGIRGQLAKYDFLEKYHPVDSEEEAEAKWTQGYERAGTTCIHGPNCKNAAFCTAGK